MVLILLNLNWVAASIKKAIFEHVRTLEIKWLKKLFFIFMAVDASTPATLDF